MNPKSTITTRRRNKTKVVNEVYSDPDFEGKSTFQVIEDIGVLLLIMAGAAMVGVIISILF